MVIKISIKIKICSNEKENYDNFCYDYNPSRKENTVRALFMFKQLRLETEKEAPKGKTSIRCATVLYK